MGSVNSSILEARSQLSLQALSRSPWVTCQKGLLSFSASLRCSQSRADPPPAASLFHLFLCPARSPRATVESWLGHRPCLSVTPQCEEICTLWLSEKTRSGLPDLVSALSCSILGRSLCFLLRKASFRSLSWASCHGHVTLGPPPTPSRLRPFRPRGSAQGRRQGTGPKEPRRAVVLTGLQTWQDTSYTFGI